MKILVMALMVAGMVVTVIPTQSGDETVERTITRGIAHPQSQLDVGISDGQIQGRPEYEPTKGFTE